MLSLIRLPFLLSAILLLLAPARSEACRCLGGVPLCEAFWKTDVVFSGTVVEIASIASPLGERERLRPLKRVRFQVLQSWRGSAGDTADITTGTGDADCGYRFQRGATYLVYAHSRNGALSTSICTRTRLLADASEDLAYVKTAVRSSATGRIFGSVRYQGDGSYPPPPERFIAGYAVELSNGQRSWRSTTDRQGRFEFTGIPAGAYSVKLSTPETEHAYGPSEVTLADPRGCAAADFYVVPDGRISLRIVDRSGAPVQDVAIELIEIASDRPQTYPRISETDGEGRAGFAQVRPGRYALGINVKRPPSVRHPFATVYFPGVSTAAEAKTIELGPGERAELGEWILSARLPERSIAGQVVWPDGRPAARASVVLVAGSTSQWPHRSVDGGRADTDAEGRFTLRAFAGISYYLWAAKQVDRNAPQWISARVQVSLEETSGPLRLELQPPVKR